MLAANHTYNAITIILQTWLQWTNITIDTEDMVSKAIRTTEIKLR